MGSMKDFLFGDTPYQPPATRHQPPAEPADPIPHDVYQLFETLAIRIMARGFKRYSADAILHRIRWEMHIERGETDFKCNNNWTPKLARWFLQRHPDMAGFFELRERRACADTSPSSQTR